MITRIYGTKIYTGYGSVFILGVMEHDGLLYKFTSGGVGTPTMLLPDPNMNWFIGGSSSHPFDLSGNSIGVELSAILGVDIELGISITDSFPYIKFSGGNWGSGRIRDSHLFVRFPP